MCECKSNVKIQEYQNQIELTLPKHMEKYWKKKTVCVDKCLEIEIKILWIKGVITTGCCCGHNQMLPYIGVIKEHINKMRDLKYVIQTNPNDIYRIDSFYPKSINITPAMVESNFEHLIGCMPTVDEE